MTDIYLRTFDVRALRIIWKRTRILLESGGNRAPQLVRDLDMGPVSNPQLIGHARNNM